MLCVLLLQRVQRERPAYATQPAPLKMIDEAVSLLRPRGLVLLLVLLRGAPPEHLGV